VAKLAKMAQQWQRNQRGVMALMKALAETAYQNWRRNENGAKISGRMA
jgi:hypothetical protein